MICDNLEVHTEYNSKFTEYGLHDNTVFHYKRGKMMRITDVISGTNHKNEKESVNNFVYLSKSNEKKNNDEHLDSNENILTVKTEWISFVNTISSGQYVGT